MKCKLESFMLKLKCQNVGDTFLIKCCSSINLNNSCSSAEHGVCYVSKSCLHVVYNFFLVIWRYCWEFSEFSIGFITGSRGFDPGESKVHEKPATQSVHGTSFVLRMYYGVLH